MFKKIDRSFIGEVAALSFIITVVLTSLLMMGRLPGFREFLFASQNIAETMVMIMIFLFPWVLMFILPISIFISSAIVTARMSLDKELEALLASGISPLRIMLPSFVLGVMLFVTVFLTSFYLEPYTVKQFEQYKWIQARAVAENFLKSKLQKNEFVSGIDNPAAKNFTIYLEDLDANKEKFSKPFISFSKPDSNSTNILVGASGSLGEKLEDTDSDLIFSLNKGILYSTDAFSNQSYSLLKKEEWSVTYFDLFRVSLVSLFNDKFTSETNTNQEPFQNPFSYFKSISSKLHENEFWMQDENFISDLRVFFRKIAICLSCLFLSIIGFCIGVNDPRRKQFGVYLGIGVGIFVFYSSLSFSRLIFSELNLSPYVMIYFPPLCMFILASFFVYWRMAYPPSTTFLEFLKILLKKISFSKS